MVNAVKDDEIEKAAQELVGRYGANAVEVASERAARFERQGNWLEQSLALRLLTAVERMTRAPLCGDIMGSR
ncbi:MAG: hypothetical protein K2Q10_09845 [Rhodospirillales bacterium]|nr:hypothetical protein [Rhodospirillales bacterium]